MGILQRTRAHFVFRSCQDRMGVRAQTNIQRMYKLCFLLFVREAARFLDEIGDKKNYLSSSQVLGNRFLGGFYTLKKKIQHMTPQLCQYAQAKVHPLRLVSVNGTLPGCYFTVT